MHELWTLLLVLVLSRGDAESFGQTSSGQQLIDLTVSVKGAVVARARTMRIPRILITHSVPS